MTIAFRSLPGHRLKRLQEASQALELGRRAPLGGLLDDERSGVWIGSGLRSLPNSGSSPRLGTAVEDGALSAVFGLHGPGSDRAVVGFELVVAPAKSIPALWAVAPQPLHDYMEFAALDAVADTLDFVEGHCVYGRRGINGVRYTDVEGVIAAAYAHVADKHGRPDLHTHIAVYGKAKDPADGAWVPIDIDGVQRTMDAVGEIYLTASEARMVELGLVFEPRFRDGRLSSREIVGVTDEVLEQWPSWAAEEVICW